MPAVATEELQHDVADATSLLFQLEKTNMEQSLHAFMKAAWSIVEPSQPFIDNWHIVELCKLLEDIDARRLRGVIVLNIPPGTLKSLLLQVFWPTWSWAKNATRGFLFGSYGQHLTTRDNVRARQILESDWYQKRWAVQLLDDQNTKTRYNTTEGGWRIATSVGGVGTGEHPNFIVIDDPVTAAEAESEKGRKAANAWYDGTLSTRKGRSPTVIIVMQRLHKDDLSGHVLARGGLVTHVCWPMRYEKCTCPGVDVTDETRCGLHKADLGWVPDPRDQRTEAGELLFPELFPEEKIRQMELDLGPYGAAGQLQQRPAPEGGGLFKRAHFKFIEVAPKLARRARGWDTGATEGGGDYTAGVKMAEDNGLYFVEDVQRGQWGPASVDANIKSTAHSDGKACAQREEKEGGASGKTVIEARTKTLAGYDYKGVPTSGSKITRAKPYRAQVEAGNVFIVRTGDPVRDAWIEVYLKELSDFPTGTHDDQVDASSAAFNAVLLEPRPRRMSAVW